MKHTQNKTKEKKKEKREEKFTLSTYSIFFQIIFTCGLRASSSKFLEHKPSTLLELFYVLEAIFHKSIFFELFTALSFPIVLSFWISTMRLFMKISFSGSISV